MPSNIRIYERFLGPPMTCSSFVNPCFLKLTTFPMCISVATSCPRLRSPSSPLQVLEHASRTHEPACGEAASREGSGPDGERIHMEKEAGRTGRLRSVQLLRGKETAAQTIQEGRRSSCFEVDIVPSLDCSCGKTLDQNG